jgi:hypothetical protein
MTGIKVTSGHTGVVALRVVHFHIGLTFWSNTHFGLTDAEWSRVMGVGIFFFEDKIQFREDNIREALSGNRHNSHPKILFSIPPTHQSFGFLHFFNPFFPFPFLS